MAGKRVTYLLGAGASANALPVVNGMYERMELFIEFLKVSTKILNFDTDPNYRINNYSFDQMDNLLNEIKSHYTIDTYAKKLFLLEENDKLEVLKRFLSAYLIFEQLETENELGKKIAIEYGNKYNRLDAEEIKNKVNAITNINITKDYRYDSVLANFLLFDTKKIDPEINLISWNYDNQFEIAYSNYRREKYSIDEIQEELQIIPSLINNTYSDKNSAIIKLNGTAGFYSNAKPQKTYSDWFDVSKHTFDSASVQIFIEILLSDRSKYKNTIRFAWEDDSQKNEPRVIAQQIISKSDIIVIIGYSFPTFNREVDRKIFKGFNEKCLKRYSLGKFDRLKRIYIQDTKENAPKIKERLKAIGNNLFEVAEIYDEVDQFFIPPEL